MTQLHEEQVHRQIWPLLLHPCVGFVVLLVFLLCDFLHLAPKSCPALADTSQLLLQHSSRITGVHKDLDCLLMTYFRHLILWFATPENKMFCPSLMTWKQRLLSCCVGNLIQATICLFSPLGPLGFLNMELSTSTW